MTIHTSGDGTFAKDVLENESLVLVDFWAEWCGPCKAIALVLEEIATEFEGKLKVVKVNIDENPETPVTHGVRSIPTLMLFKKGQVLDTQVGSLPKQALADWINRSL